MPRPPFQAHSDTSAAAAASVRPDQNRLQRVVYEALVGSEAGGMTDEELQAHTGLGPSTQRPRRVELVAAGDVVDSGRRRKTRSGRQAVVWILRKFVTGAQDVPRPPDVNPRCPEGPEVLENELPHDPEG